MFFEEEDKDLSKNMDDYDLEFEDDKSISWDKLLDEAEAEQVVPTQNEEDLLLGDDESFNSLLEEQTLIIDEDEDVSFVQGLSNNGPQNSFDDELQIISEDEYEIEEQIVQESAENLSDFGDVQIEEVSAQNNYAADIQPEYNEPASMENFEPQQAPQVTPTFREQLADLPNSNQPAEEFAQETEEELYNQSAQNVQEPENIKTRTPIKKPSKDPSILWGALAAFAFVVILGIGFFFMQNKTNEVATTGDFDALKNEDVVQGDSSAGEFDKQISGTETATNETAVQVQGETATSTQGTTATGQPAGANVAQGKTAAQKNAIKNSKKVTLKVVNTGRINPFTPVGNFNKFGFITSPNIDILEPPTKLGNLTEELDRLVKITVSGILYDSVKPSAIINVGGVDYFVQRNDRVDDFTVAAISKDTVVIKKGNNIYRASIGQNFSSGPIKGQIQRSTSRQYVTVSDINVNESSD